MNNPQQKAIPSIKIIFHNPYIKANNQTAQYALPIPPGDTLFSNETSEQKEQRLTFITSKDKIVASISKDQFLEDFFATYDIAPNYRHVTWEFFETLSEKKELGLIIDIVHILQFISNRESKFQFLIDEILNSSLNPSKIRQTLFICASWIQLEQNPY